MKLNSSSGIRKSVAGIAITACTLAAIPAAMAGDLSAPYYDSARDVMVTPRNSLEGTVVVVQDSSQGYSTPARTPAIPRCCCGTSPPSPTP